MWWFQKPKIADRYIHKNDPMLKVDIVDIENSSCSDMVYYEVINYNPALHMTRFDCIDFSSFPKLFKLYKQGPLVGQIYMDSDDPFTIEKYKILDIHNNYVKYTRVDRGYEWLDGTFVSTPIYIFLYHSKFIGNDITNTWGI